MKAYKITLSVIDFEGIGRDEIRWLLEDMRHLSLEVMRIAEYDIGEWSDDHPLNIASTASAEYQRIFATKGTHEQTSHAPTHV